MTASMATSDAGYYDFFDKITGCGRVFHQDLSEVDVPATSLTETERDARIAWSNTFDVLRDHYRRVDPPAVTSRELLLQQRLVAPRLGSSSVSSRSQAAEPKTCRMYPPRIEVWDDFRQEVESLDLATDDFPLESDYFQIFKKSLDFGAMKVNNETQEQERLLQNLYALETSKLVAEISTVAMGIGRMDFNLLKFNEEKKEISVVCEFKSTHNLLLPMEARDVVARYNAAALTVLNRKQGRTTVWSNVCHPLGQLVGYMVDNQKRYGALTCGTRTYFVHLLGSGKSTTVKVSDAWFVGQKDYLRAWVYVHRQGCQGEANDIVKPDWCTTSKDSPTPERENDHPGADDTKSQGKRALQQTSASGQDKRCKKGGCSGCDGALQMSSNVSYGTERNLSNDLSRADSLLDSACCLPHIPFQDIKILEVLGTGRNGAVFRVIWNSEEVALKQFDINKDGDAPFRQEISAYMKLKTAWGVLVPRPFFVSTSLSGGGSCFLVCSWEGFLEKRTSAGFRNLPMSFRG